MLFKVKRLETLVERKKIRMELAKDFLKSICDVPQSRDVLIEQIKKLQQEDEEDTKMMEMEFQNVPRHAIGERQQTNATA